MPAPNPSKRPTILSIDLTRDLAYMTPEQTPDRGFVLALRLDERVVTDAPDPAALTLHLK